MRVKNFTLLFAKDSGQTPNRSQVKARSHCNVAQRYLSILSIGIE